MVPPCALLPHLTFCPFSSTSFARQGPLEGLCVLQGDIYILSALDREKKDHYTLTAVARDNPGDVPSNRRENSVQVGLSSYRSLCGGISQKMLNLRPSSPVGLLVAQGGIRQKEEKKTLGLWGGWCRRLCVAGTTHQQERQGRVMLLSARTLT